MAEGNRPTLARRRRVGGDGEPEVFCADEQSAHQLDLIRWRDLAEAVVLAEGVRGAAELSVMFVERDVITELNRTYMEQDGPTDVLAFPIDAPDAELSATPGSVSRGPDRAPVDVGDLPLLLGDVVIAPAVAADQASTHAGTFDDEIALLVVHGILHVLGWDHADDESRVAMQAREVELLSALHWRGDPPGEFRQEHPE